MNIRIRVVLYWLLLHSILGAPINWDEDSLCLGNQILTRIKLAFFKQPSFITKCSYKDEEEKAVVSILDNQSEPKVETALKCESSIRQKLVDNEIKLIISHEGEESSPNKKIVIELRYKKISGVVELFYQQKDSTDAAALKTLFQLELSPAGSSSKLDPITDFVEDCVSAFVSMIDSLIDDINDLRNDIKDVFIGDDKAEPKVKPMLEEFTSHFEVIEKSVIELKDIQEEQYNKRKNYFGKVFHESTEKTGYTFPKVDYPILKYIVQPNSGEADPNDPSAPILTKIFAEIGPVDILIYQYPKLQAFIIELRNNFYQSESVIISESRALVMQHVAGMLIQYGIEMYKLLGWLHHSLTEIIPYRTLEFYIRHMFQNFANSEISGNGAKLSVFGNNDMTINFEAKLDSVFFTTKFDLGPQAQKYLGTTKTSLVFMRAFPAISQYFLAPLIQIYFFELLMSLGLPDFAAKIDLTYFRRNGSYDPNEPKDPNDPKGSKKMPEGEILNYRLIGLNYYFDLFARINFCDKKGNERQKLVYIPLEVPEIKRYVIQKQQIEVIIAEEGMTSEITEHPIKNTKYFETIINAETTPSEELSQEEIVENSNDLKKNDIEIEIPEEKIEQVAGKKTNNSGAGITTKKTTITTVGNSKLPTVSTDKGIKPMPSATNGTGKESKPELSATNGTGKESKPKPRGTTLKKKNGNGQRLRVFANVIGNFQKANFGDRFASSAHSIQPKSYHSHTNDHLLKSSFFSNTSSKNLHQNYGRILSKNLGTSLQFHQGSKLPLILGVKPDIKIPTAMIAEPLASIRSSGFALI